MSSNTAEPLEGLRASDTGPSVGSALRCWVEEVGIGCCDVLLKYIVRDCDHVCVSKKSNFSSHSAPEYFASVGVGRLMTGSVFFFLSCCRVRGAAGLRCQCLSLGTGWDAG